MSTPEIEREKEQVFGACGGVCGEAPCIAWNERRQRRILALSAAVLHDTVELSVEDAQKIIDGWNEQFPTIREFHKAIAERSREYARTEADTEAR